MTGPGPAARPEQRRRQRSSSEGADSLPPTGFDPSDAITPADAAGPVARWTVVIPVKAPAGAKTRLAPAVPPAEREALARAFALDTIAAVLAARSVARVIVVGDDASLAGGAEFLAEPADGPRGLTAAISYGIVHAGDVVTGGFDRLSPQSALSPQGAVSPRGAVVPQGAVSLQGAVGLQAGIAVLLGDLPALSPEELDAALEAASRHPLAFVRDADGTGTTLATASAGVHLAPHFGVDSAARHAAAGFVELEASAGLRRDVDTIDALAEALALGAGPRTRAAAAGISTSPR